MRKHTSLTITALLVALLGATSFAWGLGGFETDNPVVAAPTGSTSPDPDPSRSSNPQTLSTTPPAVPTLTAPLLQAAPVTVNTSGFWSWTLMDRNSGELAGSDNAGATNVTASMIKAWLAADYLRRAAERNTTPSSSIMKQLTIMIRDSDNAAASYFWRANGGNATIKRLIAMCGLTDSKAYIDWAHTLMSARDATRMGACIGDGRAAGAKWTDWVLNEMRSVRGSGRFGIISVLPADVAGKTAIKNGWIAKSDGKWHINCMAVGPDWVLSVMTVYAASRGMSHGINICKSVTQQLMVKQG
jgi:hypothetical protein